MQIGRWVLLSLTLPPSLSLSLSPCLFLSPLYYLLSPLHIWAAQWIFMKCHRGVCELHRRGPWEVMCNLNLLALKGEGGSEMPPSESSSYSLLLLAFSFRAARSFDAQRAEADVLDSEWWEKTPQTPGWRSYLLVRGSISEAGPQPPGHPYQSTWAAVTVPWTEGLRQWEIISPQSGTWKSKVKVSAGFASLIGLQRLHLISFERIN